MYMYRSGPDFKVIKNPVPKWYVPKWSCTKLALTHTHYTFPKSKEIILFTVTQVYFNMHSDTIPSGHLLLVRDLYNPMNHILNVHAHGNIACEFQSTHQKCQFLC